ncbi:MAG: DUF2442 domain-containing protein [Thermoanaerobaculia bacterium]
MSSSTIEAHPQARTVRITEDELTVELADGRRISAPLAWFPRLLGATPDERQSWEILGDGEGIRWPSLDEDLSVAGLLVGARSRTPALRRSA